MECKVLCGFEFLITKTAEIIMRQTSCTQSLCRPFPILQQQPKESLNLSFCSDLPHILQMRKMDSSKELGVLVVVWFSGVVFFISMNRSADYFIKSK
jgi:hypothetical protein